MKPKPEAWPAMPRMVPQLVAALAICSGIAGFAVADEAASFARAMNRFRAAVVARDLKAAERQLTAAERVARSADEKSQLKRSRGLPNNWHSSIGPSVRAWRSSSQPMS